MRMNRASLQSLADLQAFDFTETTLAPDGRWLAHAGKFSNEGLTGALADLLATCPPQKGIVTLQTGKPRDKAPRNRLAPAFLSRRRGLPASAWKFPAPNAALLPLH